MKPFINSKRKLSYDLGSKNLQNQFSARFHSPSAFQPDDAEKLYPSNSDIFESLIDAFWIFGNYPWENEGEPKILYQEKDKKHQGSFFLKFVFVKNNPQKELVFQHPNEGIIHVYQPSCDPDENSFEVLYFPQNKDSPFLYLYRKIVSPLTFPAFANDLDFSTLISYCTPEKVPVSEICYAVLTKFPYFDFFNKFFQWIEQSENIGRIEILPKIDSFFFEKKIIKDTDKNGFEPNPGLSDVNDDDFKTTDSFLISSKKLEWPESHKRLMHNAFIIFMIATPPSEDNSITYNEPPLPEFNWVRPQYEHAYFPLALWALRDVCKNVSCDVFTMIYSCFLLEKTTIVYSKQQKLVDNFVISLHYAIRPLHWVNSSVSPLPHDLYDLISSPTPILLGVVEPLSPESYGDDVNYVDLENRKILTRVASLLIPGMQDLIGKLKEHWTKAAEGKEEDLMAILHLLNEKVQYFLSFMPVSIVSCLSENETTKSSFVQELYLAHFEHDDRKYLKRFSETQMFQLECEKQCKKKIDTFSY